MSDLNISLNILNNVLNKDCKSNDEINRYAKEATNLSFVSKNVYGVLENKIYLDYMIRKLSSIRLKKIQDEILIILELGFYNIHFLNTKDYAIVNELVDITKKINYKSAGFVNAILRNFIRDEDEIARIMESDDIKSLSIRYSVPEDLVRYIFDNYGMDYTKKFLKYINDEQTISIRVNNMKTNRDELKNSLESIGYEVIDGILSKNSLKILNPSGLAGTDLFKDGLFTIQQESSMMAVEYLNPTKGSKILDLCAAPGTKTSYIAEVTENGSKIIANDISRSKLPLIKENLDRLDLTNVRLTSFDGAIIQDDLIEKFDYVIVDAPCSGLGVMGRKPEIRYNRTIEDIKNLSILQKEILDTAIKYLKKGGKLLFSTCTIGSLENKDNYQYLKDKKELNPIEIEGRDYIEYINFENQTDGFFISKFEKV